MLPSLFQKNLHVVCCARMHHVPRHVQPVSLTAEIKFCGLTCENPFFLASSAVCTNYEMVAKAFDAGWAGVFYKTICLQEINEVSPRFDAVHSSKRGDFYGFRNMEQLSENPVDMDFDILSRLKKNYPSKIVVASITGRRYFFGEQDKEDKIAYD